MINSSKLYLVCHPPQFSMFFCFCFLFLLFCFCKSFRPIWKRGTCKIIYIHYYYECLSCSRFQNDTIHLVGRLAKSKWLTLQLVMYLPQHIYLCRQWWWWCWVMEGWTQILNKLPEEMRYIQIFTDLSTWVETLIKSAVIQNPDWTAISEINKLGKCSDSSH